MQQTEHSRVIDHPAVILHYLEELWNQQRPLLFSFPVSDNDRIYESTIQKVDADGKRLILPMFMPEEIIREGEFPLLMNVQTQLDQGLFYFVTQLYPADDSDMPSQCLLHFPEQIVKNQLRAHFRVSLISQDTSTMLADGSNNASHGTCLDLSLGGALCQVDMNPHLELSEGAEIERCLIDIPGLLSFECSVVICRMKRLDERENLLGLNFVDLPKETGKRLSKSLVKLERDMLRSNSRRRKQDNPSN